jgi:hypothetical protein
MPLSSDPVKRERQLSNLRRGNNPAPSGNRLAVRHAGYARIARERLDAKQREVYDALAADAPVRGPDGGLPSAHAVPVRLLAEALCRLDDVSAHLRDFGVLDQRTGDPRPAAELEGRLRREALDLAEALAMTPRSAGKLGLDLARTEDVARGIAALGGGGERA